MAAVYFDWLVSTRGQNMVNFSVDGQEDFNHTGI